MAIQELRYCGYCNSPITAGQRWVRQKIYNPIPESIPRYRHYHADLDFGRGESCWEKHQLDRELVQVLACQKRARCGDSATGRNL